MVEKIDDKTINHYFEFDIEKIFAKLPLPYYITACLFSFSTFLVGIILAYYFTPSDMKLYHIMWYALSYPACLTTLVGLKYIRDSAVTVIGGLNENKLVGDDFLQEIIKYFQNTFSSKSYLYISIPLSILAFIFQVYYLIISPHPWWKICYNYAYVPTLFRACIDTITATFWWFIAGNLAYFSLRSLYAIKMIGEKIDINNINLYHPDKRGGLSNFGAFAMSISVTCGLTAFFTVLVSWLAPFRWWTLLLMISASIAFIVSLLYPLYNFHKVLCKAKYTELQRISKIYNKIYKQSKKIDLNIENINIIYINKIKEIDLLLRHLKFREELVKDVSTWPLTAPQIRRGVTIYLLSYIIYIIKFLLENIYKINLLNILNKFI